MNKNKMHLLRGSDGGLEVKDITLEQFIDFGLLDDDVSKNKALTTRLAYERQSWYRRCITLFGNTMSSMPWTSFRCETEVWTSSPKAPK